MAVVSRLVKKLPTKRLKRIATYVESGVFDDLQKWADEEDRSISNLTSRLLTQAVNIAKSEGKLSDRANSKESKKNG